MDGPGISGVSVIGASFVYLLAIFLVAWWADRQSERGRSVIASPWIYTLSLGVYCTTWTFYGSVGRSASLGIGFLPVYLGPTLVMLTAPLLLRKVLRIAKIQRSTSIADFISGRYGKSHLLAGLVALIAVVGITPYIALQLKAVSVSFNILVGIRAGDLAPALPGVNLDTAFFVALAMAAFAILFGTRHIDAAEHHPGMVAAISLEAVVKLVAFVAVGIFVVWGLNDGPGDLFSRAAAVPEIAPLLTDDPPLAGGGWVTTTLLSMAAILLLPRQFQTMVIENVDERHLNRAAWLFPLYLLIINIFVLPVAVEGLLHFHHASGSPANAGAALDPDVFVLALPLDGGSNWLALLAFLGGLSAGAGMIAVEAIALSTMICNDLVMPVLLRLNPRALDRLSDLSRLLLAIRRIAIAVILALGYGYYRFAGSAYALVAIGLISFAAVAQFAPSLIGGVFWKGGTRRGALAGLSGGILVWLYTLLLPSFARSGWLSPAFVEAGPGGIQLLSPYALLGIDGMDPLTHALFWSMLVNIGLYVLVSLFDHPSWREHSQAIAYVDVFVPERGGSPSAMRRRRSASVAELQRIVGRFIGAKRTEELFAGFAGGPGGATAAAGMASPELIDEAERALAGAIGAASARVALAAAVKGEEVSPDEIIRMLDETSQVIEYSVRLEQKTRELEQATSALTTANARLQELDRLKDEFLSTVTHELRTPLTSIRALSEILFDDPDIDLEQRQRFLGLVISESERLTRLINQVLDMAKIEAGEMDWMIGPMDLGESLHQAAAATGQLFRDKGIIFEVDIPPDLPQVNGDADRLVQVVVNLLSNAAKFTPEGGRVRLSAQGGGDVAGNGVGAGFIEVRVTDDGPGIDPSHHEMIFDRFRQVGDTMTDKPQGTGLGLAISRRIIDHLGGRLWVESRVGEGAAFVFTLPTLPGWAERIA